jgi:hypothetical protein
MNHSGDAAEQIVRMSLEGVEVAARITGTAAKEIALLLLVALKSPEKGAGGGIKPRGRERLNSMLKSGKALEIFSVKESDLRTFVREAKQYGIVYCVLRNSKNTPDGLSDIMVKADDAPKINRLVERFKFATLDKAKIESEILQAMEAKTAETPDEPADVEPVEPEINDVDSLINELMGTGEGKAAPGTDPLASGGDRPSPSGPPPKASPSEPSSGSRKNSERHTSSKPSVKEELREIAVAQKAKEAETRKREEPVAAKPKETQPATRAQPKNRRKTQKSKGR